MEHLLLDSRQRAPVSGAVYFALIGKRHDGHRFISALYGAGVRNFIVSQAIDTHTWEKANILLVSDTLLALQQLTAYHRAQFRIPVIGITGSNGKTIVKEWLSALLTPDYELARSPKSYNSQTGVPLSVWQLQPRHTLAVFEAGISLPGEMVRLEPMIRPQIGIFTNIGPAHREGFASKMEKIHEKMRLFTHTAVLIYCRDHEKIDLAALEWQQAKQGRTLLSWSKKGLKSNLQIEKEIPLSGGFTQLQAKYTFNGSSFGYNSPLFTPASKAINIVIPFLDAASVENAIHCWATTLLLDLPAAAISERMAHLETIAMRLELKAGIHRCIIINDAYNNDTASLRIALQFAAQQTRSGPLTLIMSDILQSGQKPEQLYEKVGRIAAENGVHRLIGIGKEITILKKLPLTGIETAFFPDTDAFLNNYPVQDFHDERILLKGARVFAFERIAARLEQKAHKTVLEINLSALVHNLSVFNRLLAPGVKIMAMVKAAGYGSGSVEIAKLLEFHKVDYLGVAYTDEGIELREGGINLPILVLNPEYSGFDALFRYRLEPEVYSLSLLDDLIRYAEGIAQAPVGTVQTEQNRKVPYHSLPIHLKLDTGMHRLGFEFADIPPLIQRLISNPLLRVQSIFSHLSATDAPQHDAFTRTQAGDFSAMYEAISKALGYTPLRHICNTSGIVRFPEYHFEMVRLGIGLYGTGTPTLQGQLQTVNTLKATISQIKIVAKGETVGYNRNSGILDQPVRIATISIGYADGLLRLAGNGRYSVAVRNKLVPTIGNVCMDMTMIDVTAVPDAQEGDMVMIFGEHPSVQTLAACLQTIPYEVLTNISERVKRVYLQE